ncbi:uncharacterized protein TRUGW13939_07640 [Talaromyces rugulosus]|uniref:Uncharacterized protein n=1 Tax=Talaromyces rugulosus TaxID=121627 RepID=A0A7H8R4H4_TALRU|nr:uncharacterized protein TRUGW13939_07640 [Talaromyces rugulosus]QKX60495.1 hypothetical protein TRUGW13939_07640 [Talaromyces rugulosus]
MDDAIFDHLPPPDSTLWASAAELLKQIHDQLETAQDFYSTDRTCEILAVNQILVHPPTKKLVDRFQHVIGALLLAIRYHELYPQFHTAEELFWRAYRHGHRGEGRISEYIENHFQTYPDNEKKRIRQYILRGRKYHLVHLAVPGLCLILSMTHNILDNVSYDLILVVLKMFMDRDFRDTWGLRQLVDIERNFIMTGRGYLSFCNISWHSSYTEIPRHLDPEPRLDMDSYEFVQLKNIGEPQEHLVQGIKNYLHRYDSEPNIRTEIPTRIYRGRAGSHFAGVLAQFFKRINVCFRRLVKENVTDFMQDVHIFQTFLKIAQSEGTTTDPVVAVTNDTRTSRLYRIGPVGQDIGKAITLILPLDKNLDSDEGFFSYYPGSARWTREQFEDILASKDRKSKALHLPLRDGLLLPEGLVVEYPSEKPCCHYISKTYIAKVPALDELLLRWEATHIIPCTRYISGAMVIDDSTS